MIHDREIWSQGALRFQNLKQVVKIGVDLHFNQFLITQFHLLLKRQQSIKELLQYLIK